jgi:hypothetical protein
VRPKTQTAIVILSAVGISASGLLGLIGSPIHPERFDAKTVVVAPAGNEGVRITEYVDIDFGSTRRRGYERVIPTDFGVPTEITAMSPSAPSDVSTALLGNELRIRVGDPNITITGRHRYELRYTLPAARLSSGYLALDIIGTEETLLTRRFTVIITGFALTDTTCSVGVRGAVGGCALLRTSPGLETVIAPLQPGQGITVEGVITGIGPPVAVDPGPPLPQRSERDTRPIAAVMLIGGIATGTRVIRRSAQRGVNLVGAEGGAAGAAFGDDSGPTREISDRELTALATIEFAPPSGIAPWEGKALLEESVTEEVTEAWFTSLQGDGVIELAEKDDALLVTAGSQFHSLDTAQAQLLGEVLPADGALRLKEFDPKFALVWAKVGHWQRDHLHDRNWWNHKLSTIGPKSLAQATVGLAVVLVLGTAITGWVVRKDGADFGQTSGTWWFAIFWSMLAAALIAQTAGTSTRRRRTAAGSAAYLRTESFRRFLAASEARHVEEAWKRGVLREYTAWAVALGEADAWRRAAEALANPAVSAAVTGAALSSRRYFSAAHTRPSSGSGSGGRGGVGGGGGGGRSGSW